MFLQTLLAKIAPYECLGCTTEGRLVCLSCAATLGRLPERCYHCRRLSVKNKTCASCRSQSNLYAVHVATNYSGLAKELVWRLKFSGAQSAAREMAALMKIPLDEHIILIPIPTATSRRRRRGYDQAYLLAKAVARQYRLSCLTCLRRNGQQHQVGATRQQRITQLQTAYRCVAPHRIAGAHVLLVDDVLTTGATLEAAAKVLKQAGAKHVSALTFAQA
jgi:ComF family protein